MKRPLACPRLRTFTATRGRFQECTVMRASWVSMRTVGWRDTWNSRFQVWLSVRAWAAVVVSESRSAAAKAREWGMAILLRDLDRHDTSGDGRRLQVERI